VIVESGDPPSRCFATPRPSVFSASSTSSSGATTSSTPLTYSSATTADVCRPAALLNRDLSPGQNCRSHRSGPFGNPCAETSKSSGSAAASARPLAHTPTCHCPGPIPTSGSMARGGPNRGPTSAPRRSSPRSRTPRAVPAARVARRGAQGAGVPGGSRPRTPSGSNSARTEPRARGPAAPAGVLVEADLEGFPVGRNPELADRAQHQSRTRTWKFAPCG